MQSSKGPDVLVRDDDEVPPDGAWDGFAEGAPVSLLEYELDQYDRPVDCRCLRRTSRTGEYSNPAILSTNGLRSRPRGCCPTRRAK